MSDPIPQQPPDPSSVLTLHKLWLDFFYQEIAFLVTLVVLVNHAEYGGYRPEWELYSFGAGTLLTIPPGTPWAPRSAGTAKGKT